MVDKSQVPATRQAAERAALALSTAGALVMAVLVVILYWTGPQSPLFGTAADALKLWGALLLAFLSGIRWGLALANEPVSSRVLALACIAPLVAFLVLVLADQAALILLFVAFAAHGAWDTFAIHAGAAPLWFARVRMVATLAVSLCLLAAIFLVQG